MSSKLRSSEQAAASRLMVSTSCDLFLNFIDEASELLDGRLVEFDARSCAIRFDVLGLGGARDGDELFVLCQLPGHDELRHRNALLFGDFFETCGSIKE